MKKTYKVIAPMLIPLTGFLSGCHAFEIMNGLKPVIPNEYSYEKNDKYAEIEIDKSLKNYYLGKTDFGYSGLENFIKNYDFDMQLADSYIKRGKYEKAFAALMMIRDNSLDYLCEEYYKKIVFVGDKVNKIVENQEKTVTDYKGSKLLSYIKENVDMEVNIAKNMLDKKYNQ